MEEGGGGRRVERRDALPPKREGIVYAARSSLSKTMVLLCPVDHSLSL